MMKTIQSVWASWMGLLIAILGVVVLLWGCDETRPVYASQVTTPEESACVCGSEGGEEGASHATPAAQQSDAAAPARGEPDSAASTRRPRATPVRAPRAQQQDEGWIDVLAHKEGAASVADTPREASAAVARGDEEEPHTSGHVGVINLNTATPAQLELLPGVGPAMSAKIVAHRERRPFTSVAQLRRVKGVGPTTYARLKPHARVDGPTTLRAR